MASGGIPTSAGVRYEILALMYHVPDLLSGEISALRYQLPVMASPSANRPLAAVALNDFWLGRETQPDSFFQAKQNTTLGSWTIAGLARGGSSSAV